jgi:signal transduction histidine kinase
MQRFYPRTIRAMLFLLLLVVLAPVLLTQSALYYRRFETRRAEELQANLELAQALAAAFETYIQDIVRQELLLGRALSTAPPPDPERATHLLVAAVRQTPAAREYSWLDGNGQVLFSSNYQAAGRDLSGQPWIRAVQHGQEWIVSDLYPSADGEEAVFAVARGIYSASGVLQGIMLATVDGGRASGVTPPLGRAGETAVVLDRSGVLVYCDPAALLAWEQRSALAGHPLVVHALQGEPVYGVLRSVVGGCGDGDASITGIAPIRSIGWAAAVMRPEDAALASMRHDLIRDVGLFSLSVVAAILAAMAVGRRLTVPVRRLRAHALAVGRGELQRRVVGEGPVELQELAMAFNRMAMEIQVRAAQREEYVHAISHDLRSPLTVVSGHAQRLAQLLSDGAEPQLVQSVEAILRGTRRMAVLIQNLVETARLEGDMLRLHLQPVDLPVFMRELLAQLAPLDAVERIQVEIPPMLPSVLADPDHLERIMMNLLLNAVKYSPLGSPVIVRVQLGAGEVITSVQDRGPGIAPSELPHLFDRYRRGIQAGEHREGLGLGLYIVKGLVEAHGGRVWVESAPGAGSTFSFSLSTCHSGTPAG